MSQYVVRGTFVIPAGYTPRDAQTVTITFAPPPGQPAGPSYTQTLAFTVN